MYRIDVYDNDIQLNYLQILVRIQCFMGNKMKKKKTYCIHEAEGIITSVWQHFTLLLFFNNFIMLSVCSHFGSLRRFSWVNAFYSQQIV